MGGSLVTVPLMGLVSPLLIPVPTLFTGLVRTIMILQRDISGLDRKGLVPIIGGCVPGSFLGALVVSHLSNDALVALASFMVLMAILFSARGWRIKDRIGIRAGLGFASGFMATVSSIAGPAIALLYLDAKNNVIRATLAVFFMVTNALALIFLTSFGKVHHEQLLVTLEILPGTLVGYLISTRLINLVDKRSVRPLILIIAGFSACLVLVQKLHLI